MRYAFLLKKRTGLNISDNCLTRVSHEIARAKAAATAPANEPIEVNVDEPLIPPAVRLMFQFPDPVDLRLWTRSGEIQFFQVRFLAMAKFK